MPVNFLLIKARDSAIQGVMDAYKKALKAIGIRKEHDGELVYDGIPIGFVGRATSTSNPFEFPVIDLEIEYYGTDSEIEERFRLTTAAFVKRVDESRKLKLDWKVVSCQPIDVASIFEDNPE